MTQRRLLRMGAVSRSFWSIREHPMVSSKRPQALAARGACSKAGIPLKLRMQDGYDHSYFFISTFMDDHMTWHAERLSL